MSSLFWVVFDEKQKNKAEEILATFDKDSKDEMGLMSITIALSSKMFPGTSVLHTRLRYVFLVGWIFLDVLKNNKQITMKLLHAKELELRQILQENMNKNPKDFIGILGSTKTKGEKLSQPPFNIYFNLLKEWSVIRDKKLSVTELHIGCFCPKYLAILDDNFKIDNFKLTKSEKNYIKETVPQSILHTLFNENIKLEKKESFIDFNKDYIVDKEQQLLFQKSKNLSLLMWGTMLYYNYYLGNKYITSLFSTWLGRVKDVINSKWKPKDTFDEIEKVTRSQKEFIGDWYEYIKDNIENITLENPPSINKKTVEVFLKEREFSLKSDRARLLPKQKSEFINSENLEAKFGIHAIQYRWSNIIRFKEDLDNATD